MLSFSCRRRGKDNRIIAIPLKIQTKSSHKIHRSELLRLDFVNLNSWIAITIYIIYYVYHSTTSKDDSATSTVMPSNLSVRAFFM